MNSYFGTMVPIKHSKVLPRTDKGGQKFGFLYVVSRGEASRLFASQNRVKVKG